MRNYLNSRLLRWIEAEALALGLFTSEAAQQLDRGEIAGRIEPYPLLQPVLAERPIDIPRLAALIETCAVMGGKYPVMNFYRFVENEGRAQFLIARLIDRLENATNPELITHIDTIIEQVVQADYLSQDDKPDWSGATRFVSAVLTATNSRRFVDFPSRRRWLDFGEQVGWSPPDTLDTYGEWILWASELACAVAETATFQTYWPGSDPRYSEPLWVISGLCAGHHRATKRQY